MTATRSLSASVQMFGHALLAGDAGCPDAELVRRFAESCDHGAFAALVRRHGAAVYGVCRRVLRHEQDAEDAFQATFVVLARNAGSVRRAGAVGGWLHGVAYNVACKARAARQRRAAVEYAASRPAAVAPDDPRDWRDVLDAELAALPEKYRVAVVLCDLHGMTADAAAREVGCPPKTLWTRLSRGRARLGARLVRRGVTPPAGALALAAAEVPSGLLESAARVAVGFASGSAAPPALLALTEGVTNVMLHKSPKYIALLACLALAVGGLAHHAPTRPRKASAAAAPAEKPPAPDLLRRLHVFLIQLHDVVYSAYKDAPAGAEADEGEKAKAAAPSGKWVRKEGELKIEFVDKESLKLYPHGENEVIVIACEYSVEKDGRIKVKVTGLEGKEEAKKKAKEQVPVGTKFSFSWKVKDSTATVSEVKGDKADTLKTRLEGDYAEKK